MRIALLGGTRFVGRAIAAELAAADHELCLVHRGETEPHDLPAALHAHADRRVGCATRWPASAPTR